MQKDNLIIEFITQEIPASSQMEAHHSFLDFFIQTLTSLGAQFDESNPRPFCAINTAPRVIILTCSSFVIDSSSLIKETRGPKLGVNLDIVQAFCKKYNTSIENLIKDEEKGHYFYREAISKERWAGQIVTHLLLHYRWPKAMRWGEVNITWIRPLIAVHCYLNGYEVALDHFIPSTAQQIHHRQLDRSSAQLAQSGAMQEVYQTQNSIEQKYLDNGIILSREKRKALILEQFKALNFTCNDEELLEMVVGLAEYPRVIEINDVFIDILPFEIVNVALKHHQKVFCAINEKSTNYVKVFVVVNRCIDSPVDQIVNGYRRVISARIADALYLLKKDLQDLATGKLFKKAKNSLINEKIGTVHQQSQRINSIALSLLEHNGRDFMDFKIDCGSAITEEFIELKGFYSFFLLKHQHALANNPLQDGQQAQFGEKTMNQSLHFTAMRNTKDFDRLEYEREIFSEFYLLESLGEHNILYPLLDKFDYLVGLLLFNHKVTGSTDPYQLRRVAKIILNVFMKYDSICNLRLWDYLLIFAFSYNNTHFVNKVIPESKIKEMHDFILARSDNQILIDIAAKHPQDFCICSASKDPFITSETKRLQFTNTSAPLCKRINNFLSQVSYKGEEICIAHIAQLLQEQTHLLSSFVKPEFIRKTVDMLNILTQIRDRVSGKYNVYLADIKNASTVSESFARHVVQINRSSIVQDYLPYHDLMQLMLQTQNLLDNVKIVDQEQNVKMALNNLLFAQKYLIE
ncbi:Glycine--tRNA ligase beta subunit [Rickettsiales endosymbiont of Paramecium tredecaurelia]|uniref:glycine--tRNA ligase subunit beta n=1 Tax=Candidatus Sarmatiella mevalonica TaxID=2770581 RepID=UPI001924CA51|nr:glycine--tRNA ligase subunit beta [Candidatus Sarmatiella mevalonica]MBL3284836.1 Glycine--tRNA ligase beta subunit [Candidatus Sarmatiella mevalonica]